MFIALLMHLSGDRLAWHQTSRGEIVPAIIEFRYRDGANRLDIQLWKGRGSRAPLTQVISEFKSKHPRQIRVINTTTVQGAVYWFKLKPSVRSDKALITAHLWNKFGGISYSIHLDHVPVRSELSAIEEFIITKGPTWKPPQSFSVGW